MRYLDFYISDEEKNFTTPADKHIHAFVKPINALRDEPAETYYRLLQDNPRNVKNQNHIQRDYHNVL